jgi:DNA polymerase-4
MTLAVAERRVKDLQALPLDFPAYELMNTEIEKVASRYAPAWENDNAGNLYLDITGTAKLFGPPADCSIRILRDIFDQALVKPAVAVACNKLVSKVATRTIRPSGLIQVREGTETEFLSHQDIRILPGMGPSLLKTAAATGISVIGEMAALSTAEALSLFGKKGPLLRDMALGVDNALVEGGSGKKTIIQQADFNEDVIEETLIRKALESLAEHGGLQMRNEKLGMRNLKLAVVYSDGVKAFGFEKAKRPLVTDGEIMKAACRVYQKTAKRRIRVRSVGLCFEDFVPLGYQPDLFEPETDTAGRRLQEAVDKIQNKYGEGKITRGLVLWK